MKKRIFMPVLAIMLCASMYGSNPDDGKQVSFEEVRRTDGDKGRPLSLGADFPLTTSIDGVWKNGMLKLEFGQPEGAALILIEGVFTGGEMQVNVDTSHPVSVNVGYPEEPILITVKTSMGNIYEGCLNLCN